MKRNRNFNVEVFQRGKLEWHNLLLAVPKKKRKSFVIFMFIANNSIFKSFMSIRLVRSMTLK